MSQLGDKLLGLLDFGEGLMARTHYLIGTDRPKVLNEDIARMTTRLYKRWPQFPDQGDRSDQSELFFNRSVEIVSALSDYFNHLVNLHQFKERALSLLTEMSTRILEFQFETNKEIMTRFFDLFLGYAKLYLLSSHLPDMHEYAIVFAYAWQQSKGTQHPKWGIVQEYVDSIAGGDSACITVLRRECEPLAFHMGQSLTNIALPFYRMSENEFLIDKNVFGILDTPATLGVVDDSKTYENLLHLWHMKQWILFGYLLCPNELQTEESRRLLLTALSDTFLVPLYRSFYLPIHEHMDKMFVEYKHKMFKLSKYRSLCKTALAYAVVEAPERHRSNRRYLVAELGRLVRFFRDFPGALGPKLQVVLAGMELCKQELQFYLAHWSNKALRKAPKFSEERWKDAYVGDLVLVRHELATLLQEHELLVRDFCMELLQTRVPFIQKHVAEIMESASANLMTRTTLESMVGTLQTADDLTDFSSFRHDWFVLATTLSEAQSGMSSKSSKALMQAVAAVVPLTEALDDLDDLLGKYGSLHELVYYKKFRVMFRETLSSQARHTRASLACIAILGSVKFNLHRFCPEEETRFATHIPGLAEEMLLELAGKAMVLVGGLYLAEAWLLHSILPVEAYKRMVSEMQGDGRPELLPGYESLYSNSHVRGMRDWRAREASLCQLVTSIREEPIIHVYNSSYSPFEFIREAVLVEFRDKIRTIVFTEDRFERPLVFTLKMQSSLNAFQKLASHLNIEFDSIAKFVLLGETCIPAVVGRPGEPVRPPTTAEGSGQPDTVIECVSSFYINFLLSNISKFGIMESDVAQGFVRVPAEYSHHIAKPDAEDQPIYSVPCRYVHQPEMDHLVLFVGPYGVRFIESQILGELSSHIGVLREILDVNRSTFKAILSRVTQPFVWLQAQEKLKRVDQAVHIALRVALLLRFRRMLFRSMHTVMDERHHHMGTLVHDIASRLHPQYRSDQLEDFYALARDLGHGSVATDPGLRAVLSKHAEQRLDFELWRLLPHLFGFMFVAKQWQRTSFVVQYQAHTNNGHLIAETVLTLITGFGSLPPLPGTVLEGLYPEQIESMVKDQVKKFVEFASYSILHMRKFQQQGQFSEYDMEALQAFLQQFVQRPENPICMSDVEATFPFSILRASNIHLNEAQTEQGKAFAFLKLDEDEKEDVFH